MNQYVIKQIQQDVSNCRIYAVGMWCSLHNGLLFMFGDFDNKMLGKILLRILIICLTNRFSI